MTSNPGNNHPISFDRVLDALHVQGITPRSTRGGAKASCPLDGHKHGDRSPSLSIQYIAKDGRTRVRCHMADHQGREEDILAVLGLTFADLYDEQKTSMGSTWSPSPRRRGTSQPDPARSSSTTKDPRASSKRAAKGERAKVVAEYVYADVDGQPVMQVLRFEPKDFRQKKWDGTGWVWGAPTAENRVLYRLPEVRAAADAGGTVHLCEGEKDADAVAGALSEGTAATTSPMGADKWLEVYTEQLAGAGQVIVWRDKDDSGSKQARTVTAALAAAEIPFRVVEAAEGKDAADHLHAGKALDEALDVDPRVYTNEDDETAEGNVVPIDDSPAPLSTRNEIPMGKGTWCYTLGGENGPRRGVYTYIKSGDAWDWSWVAPLPHVHARIVLRDGTGRRTGTAYLLSTTENSKPSLVDHDQVTSAAWSAILGIPLSAASQVQQAAATAIFYAAEGAEEREATPRVVNGRVTVPTTETLPGGYLEASRYSRDEARSGWARLIDLVSRSPKMALVVGASAVAPFVAASRRQSHVVYLYGDAAQGKTVALNTAGCIWGTASASAEDDSAQVVTPWNASGQGPTRFFGDLGVLPPIWDEIGQASFRGAQEWGKFIFDICEGAQRITPDRNGGTKYTKPWHGIFIAAGNGRMLDGLGAGKYAGVNRRVLELPTPLTLDAVHAEQIEQLWEVVFGHAGHALLAEHSAETVRPLIEAASEKLPTPDSAVGAAVARHLHSHVAGAALLDMWAGTGTLLQDAALDAAVDYLDTWAEPEHDADRMIAAVRDAIAREPGRWPTASVYTENRRPITFGGTGDDEVGPALPRHGVDRSITGLRHDEGEWVALFSHSWKEICADLGLDAAVTARELHTRGVLQVSEAKRRRGEWVSQIRAAGTGMYKLVLPDEDEEETETTQPPIEEPPTLPADDDGGVGEGPGRCGSGVGDGVGHKQPVTCDVVGVVGDVGQTSHAGARDAQDGAAVESVRHEQPCVICSTPARHTVAGDPIHLGECQRQWRESHEQPDAETAVGQQEAAAPASTPVPGTLRAGPQRSGGKRWTAPAAAVDAETIYLPGGVVEPIPEHVTHLGHLAALTRPESLAIGHGGDRLRLPDIGSLWLLEGALDRFGWPTSLPAAQPGDSLDHRKAQEKRRTKMLSNLAKAPSVADALAEGWQIQGAGVREWTRIWHPEDHKPGAWIVAHPWQRLDEVSLWSDAPEPSELVDRLARFADAVGMTYRLNPAATGVDFIDHTRPPAREGHEGPSRAGFALTRGEGADLPPFLHKTGDRRFFPLGSDISWLREWSKLDEGERSRRYVHAFDRNKSYLAPWSNIELGTGDLRHLTGEDATWDGKSEKPGYFRIDDPGWTHTHLPDPATTSGARMSDGTLWVTVHTLKQLAMHDVPVTIHEAWVWGQSSRYLEPASKVLRPILTGATQGPVEETIKALFSRTVGMFGQNDHDPDNHLWRPDWRHHIVANSITGIMHTLTKNAERCGVFPLAVSHDLIVYASDEADPAAAWPGDPAKLTTTTLGGWKHVGRADLAQWGPKHLVRGPGAWRYSDAVRDLR